MAPEHALVAKQWSGVRRSDDEEHFFAVLDFANGQQVFQKVSAVVVLRGRRAEGACRVVDRELTSCTALYSSDFKRRRLSSCSCLRRAPEQAPSSPRIPSTLAGRELLERVLQLDLRVS